MLDKELVDEWSLAVDKDNAIVQIESSSNFYRRIPQVDLVPTLAVLLGED